MTDTKIQPDARAIQHVLCLIDQAIKRKKSDLGNCGSFSGSDMLHSLYMTRIWLQVEQSHALEVEVKYRKEVLKQVEPVLED